MCDRNSWCRGFALGRSCIIAATGISLPSVQALQRRLRLRTASRIADNRSRHVRLCRIPIAGDRAANHAALELPAPIRLHPPAADEPWRRIITAPGPKIPGRKERQVRNAGARGVSFRTGTGAMHSEEPASASIPSRPPLELKSATRQRTSARPDRGTDASGKVEAILVPFPRATRSAAPLPCRSRCTTRATRGQPHWPPPRSCASSRSHVSPRSHRCARALHAPLPLRGLRSLPPPLCGPYWYPLKFLSCSGKEHFFWQKVVPVPENT